MDQLSGMSLKYNEVRKMSIFRHRKGSIPLVLTHNHLETHGYLLSTMVTDVVVLKHQANSSHNAD